jgi:hypothetical protein
LKWKRSCTPAFPGSRNAWATCAAGACRYEPLFSQSNPRRRLAWPPPTPVLRPFPRTNPARAWLRPVRPPELFPKIKKQFNNPSPRLKVSGQRFAGKVGLVPLWCADCCAKTLGNGILL